MAESTIVEAVRFLKKRLEARRLHVAKVILFGSQSRGEATGESDIDLVIVSEDFRGKDIFERVDLVKDAEAATIRKFVVPFDIVTMTPEELESEGALIAAYARNGELI